MSRRRKEAASVTLTIRMTHEDRELLDRLVAKRSLELSDEGLAVTATSVIRGMIRREARAMGLLPALGAPSGIGSPPPLHVDSPSDEPPSDSVAPERAHEEDPRVREVRMGLLTPMVPTGMSDPNELRPCRLDDEALDSEADADGVRQRAVRAIRGRVFRQRDLVERTGLGQQTVSRFLLGATASRDEVRVIAGALEQLEG